MSMTAAMVLCAGFGTRLRPLSDELAKPLMPVGDRPMLAHVVETLGRGGVRKLVINTHHRSDDFDSGINNIHASIQVLHESEILGTAGGVANASDALGDSDVVVWNGDILAPDLDVAALIERRRAIAASTLWVVEPRASGEGTVGLDARGHVVRLRGERFGSEASGGDFLGIQAMSAEFRATLPHKGCLVADVALPWLRSGGMIGSFAFGGAWDDVGTPDMLLRANLRWLERKGVASFRADGASLEAGARLERSIVGAGGLVRGAGLVRDCVVFLGGELHAPASRTIAGRKASVTVRGPATE
jgi:mannose-1-phosphate guanylyltransferase